MKLDAVYLAVMFAAQFFIFSKYSPEFLIDYNLELWEGIVSVLCAAYPCLRRRFAVDGRIAFGYSLLRLATIFVVSTTASLLAIGFTARDGFKEWELGAFLIAVPPAVVGIVSYALSYAVLRLRPVINRIRSARQP